jgi:hypothetical protein
MRCSIQLLNRVKCKLKRSVELEYDQSDITACNLTRQEANNTKQNVSCRNRLGHRQKNTIKTREEVGKIKKRRE